MRTCDFCWLLLFRWLLFAVWLLIYTLIKIKLFQSNGLDEPEDKINWLRKSKVWSYFFFFFRFSFFLFSFWLEYKQLTNTLEQFRLFNIVLIQFSLVIRLVVSFYFSIIIIFSIITGHYLEITCWITSLSLSSFWLILNCPHHPILLMFGMFFFLLLIYLFLFLIFFFFFFSHLLGHHEVWNGYYWEICHVS